MSEMTTAILVYQQDRDELRKWVKRKKKKAFLMHAGEVWTCMLLENDLRTAEKWAGSVSKELGKPVLYLGLFDEFGWRADFWEAGKLKIHIDLPFERPRKAKIDLSGFATWQRFAGRPSVLEKLKNELESPRRLQPDLVDLFREAFGLEHLRFISYDQVDSYSEEMLEERGIQSIGGKKRPRVKQAILDVLQETFVQHGYRLDPGSWGSYMPDGCRFFTLINSYRYQVWIDFPEREHFKIRFIPPYMTRSMERWHKNNGFPDSIAFSSDLQLRTKLLEMKQRIVDIGILWLESHRIEEVELDPVFERTVTPVMQERGFSRKDLSGEQTKRFPNLAHLTFCYSSQDGKWRILFSFSEGFPSYWIYIRRYRQEVRSKIPYSENLLSEPDNTFVYKSEKELEQQLSLLTDGFFEMIDKETSLWYSEELSRIDF